MYLCFKNVKTMWFTSVHTYVRGCTQHTYNLNNMKHQFQIFNLQFAAFVLRLWQIDGLSGLKSSNCLTQVSQIYFDGIIENKLLYTQILWVDIVYDQPSNLISRFLTFQYLRKYIVILYHFIGTYIAKYFWRVCVCYTY